MPASSAPRRKVSLERTYKAPLADVWALWTTKDGIESWWGPDGFRVEVRAIDLRPGGELEYDMIAMGDEQIAFLKENGMPLVQPARITYTEVSPKRRLGYDHLVDFFPDTDPYHASHLVELDERPEGVRMVLTFEAMHNEQFTNFAIMGWKMEFEKLARALTARG